MTDKPVLNTPGELLIAARNDAGLQLEEVSERTKIPIAVLRSLELDEYHKVSGPLYVNSFLRTYAADVGLEPSLVLEAYARFSGEVIGSAGQTESEHVWTEEEVKIRRVGLPWGLIGGAVGVVAVLVLLGIWIFGGGDEEAAEPVAGVPPQTRTESLLPEPPQPSPADSLAAAAAGEDPRDDSRIVSESDAGTGETVAAEAPAPAPQPEQEQPSALPGADEGVPALSFGDGARWPLVLRVVATEPVGIEVVRDADRTSTPALWPSGGQTAPALPTVGVRHGQPYRVREGWAVYWGARDQFSLRLDRTAGVEVTLNGERRDLSGLQAGQELILFLSGAGR